MGTEEGPKTRAEEDPEWQGVCARIEEKTPIDGPRENREAHWREEALRLFEALQSEVSFSHHLTRKIALAEGVHEGSKARAEAWKHACEAWRSVSELAALGQGNRASTEIAQKLSTLAARVPESLPPLRIVGHENRRPVVKKPDPGP